MRHAICILLLLSIGCAGLQQHIMLAPEPVTERCENLEARYEFWGAIGVGAGAMSTAGIVGTAPLEDKDARIGVSIAAAALVGLATAAMFIRDDVADLYGAECEDLSVITSTNAEDYSEDE